MLIEAILKIFADNPPSIAIVLGGLMLLVGYLLNIEGIIIAGWFFSITGVGLQVLWLLKK